jgi:hypothetical protein
MRRYAFLICTLAGCQSTPTDVTFEFVHGSAKGAPTYRATTTDAELIARVRSELQKPMAERSLHINGRVSAGTADNPHWNWHFDPTDWDLSEMSMELCDGQPSYVSENLEKWLEEVGSYCPWASRASREL